MKTKYVCHGLISLHGNFHDNRTKWTVVSNKKIAGGGGRKKSQIFEEMGRIKEFLGFLKNLKLIENFPPISKLV